MKKFVLFDFDGVIADSYIPAYESQKAICPHLTVEDHRTRFEGNINEWQEPENVHTAECRLDQDFFEIYLPRMKNEVGIIPGMKEVIIELEKDYSLVVISSTITSPIEEFLVSHDLRSHFDWVMGNDVHTSKVEKMKMAFAKYGIGPSDCVFITDTLGDMREGNKMGVKSVGVIWGFHDPARLERGNPFRLVAEPAELPPAVSDYFASL